MQFNYTNIINLYLVSVSYVKLIVIFIWIKVAKIKSYLKTIYLNLKQNKIYLSICYYKITNFIKIINNK